MSIMRHSVILAHSPPHGYPFSKQSSRSSIGKGDTRKSLGKRRHSRQGGHVVDMSRSLNSNMLCSKEFDPRLREIIAAWPSLPKLFANGLHAMVQAMTKS
jgi:hypothetical protein